ncbi:methionyl-tRNA formyltransferase [Alloacidobacterium sp.]|uniref:methionyl-tRNA formyltransferase n=1 Tax=Alloacidobacterium sp. TaxID=2951999 RepID=UPI002D53C720|nr:methionyl-tRNA formyltransferase [Alloacidobacterium sp.]HYK34370.1 methionyl-tRNA formyltransferase [Alloacidobacterium sp.]
MRLVFCGTPRFAVPTLKALLHAGHDIQLVVTQPDRPSGRGMSLLAPPVKQAALEAGLSVVQPEKIKNNAEFRTQLEAIQPEAIIVVAYGRIIPKWMLDLPRHGNLNLHASLLPKYRGAAPIQWAVANGEPVTGATTMRIDEGLDTGDMLLQRELPVAPDQTAEDIFPLLAEMGAPLMAETLEGLNADTITPKKQDDSLATLAPILKREDGLVDFERPAMGIYNRWRGFQPWPGAYTLFRGKKLVLHRMMPMELRGEQSVPTEVRVERNRLFVDCSENSRLEIFEVQPEGKKRMAAADFLHGYQLKSGDRLG